MRRSEHDGKPEKGRQMMLAVPAEQFKSGIFKVVEPPEESQMEMLQVKATPLKNDRMRVELVIVQGKVETTSGGEVALRPRCQATDGLHR